MTSPELAQGHRFTHQCRNTESRCPTVEWSYADMRGASDFTHTEWVVTLHANFTSSDGWESQRQLPTMFLAGAVCDLHALVIGLLHEGNLFAGADSVHVFALRQGRAQ